MNSAILIKEKIGFIGGGNMATAICEGLVKKGKYSRGRVPILFLSLISFKG